MKNINLSETRVPHALLVAPRNGSVEVAAYVTSDGDTITSNAGINPYSPIDGKPMQALSSKRLTLNPRRLNSFVKVGHCAACDSDLMATASLADAIETSGSSFNCTYCSMPVTAEINYRNLITALAEEHDEDDSENTMDEDPDASEVEDSDEAAPADDDADVDDSAVDDSEDMSDESDEDTDEFDDADDMEPTAEDTEEPVVDEGDVSEDDTSEEEPTEDEVPDEDEEDPEEEQPTEFASAVRQLRRRMKALGMADEEDFDGTDDADGEAVDGDADDNADLESDDDIVAEDEDEPVGDEEDPGEEPDEDAEYDDDQVEEAAEAFRKVVAHRMGERPIAGKGVDRSDIADLNFKARATLAARRGNKIDGNAPLKGLRALAGFEVSNDDMCVTPGTNATEGEKNSQVETPGSNRKPPRNPDTQDTIPGVGPGAETSGDNIVDWRNDTIELVATSNDASRWVFVNGRPVAQLYKQHASKGVVAKWDNMAVIEKSFVAVAKRGMPVEEAKEFGYRPHRFVVKADEVVKNAMRRQAEISTTNANNEVARRIERYQQSVKTALLAVAKGVYPEVKNPMRDALVASLTKISVAEPRGIVDSAMAASLDKFAITVFNKADEIASKSDEARNEIASFVSSASFQARLDTASIVAAQLGSNSNKIVAGGFQPQREVASVDSEAKDQGALVRRALRSIRS